MMLNDIVTAISVKLNRSFGDSYEIYTENVEQGLVEPSFFIQSRPVMNRPLLGKRKQRTYPFTITYFPEKGNEEMMDVAERLMDALEFITTLDGDIIRGASLESEIVDEVLHLSVSYTVFLACKESKDTMREILPDVELKRATDSMTETMPERERKEVQHGGA